MKKTVILSCLMLTASACGTIFSGTGQEINFDSNEKDVEVFIDGVRACKTPCTYEVDRSISDLDIVAKKKGFRNQQITLRSNFNKMAVLNLSFLTNWTTDFAFGGVWEYKRNNVYIDMEKLSKQNASLDNNLAPNMEKLSKQNASLDNNLAPNIRRFALFGYDEMKIEAAKNIGGEYISSLAAITKKDEVELIALINQTSNEVELAHKLTGIE